MGAFHRLLKLTAARTGQLLNTQSLASDASFQTKQPNTGCLCWRPAT